MRVQASDTVSIKPLVLWVVTHCPTFWYSLLVPSSGGLQCLILEDRTRMLFWNVSKQLPIQAV